MKKILIFVLLLNLIGCSRNNNIKKDKDDTVTIQNDESEKKPKEPKTIIEEKSVEINENGFYEVIYNDERVLSVDGRYMIDETALMFSEPIEIGQPGMTLLSGEFRYTHNGDNYVTKLNKICIDYFYMGTGGKSFFHITVKGNKINYWLYSEGKAELVINKVWKFIPNEVMRDE